MKDNWFYLPPALVLHSGTVNRTNFLPFSNSSQAMHFYKSCSIHSCSSSWRQTSVPFSELPTGKISMCPILQAASGHQSCPGDLKFKSRKHRYMLQGEKVLFFFPCQSLWMDMGGRDRKVWKYPKLFLNNML